jgi:hypothetical protein
MLDNFADVGGGEELAAMARNSEERQRERERAAKFFEAELLQGHTLEEAIDSYKKEYGIE